MQGVCVSHEAVKCIPPRPLHLQCEGAGRGGGARVHVVIAIATRIVTVL